MTRSLLVLTLTAALLGTVVPDARAACSDMLLNTGDPTLPGTDRDPRWFVWQGPTVGGTLPAPAPRAIDPQPGWYVPDPAWTTARWIVPDAMLMVPGDTVVYNLTWTDPPGGRTVASMAWAADHGAEIWLNGWPVSPYLDATASSLHFGNWSAGPWFRDGQNWLEVRVRTSSTGSNALFAGGYVRFCT